MWEDATPQIPRVDEGMAPVLKAARCGEAALTWGGGMAFKEPADKDLKRSLNIAWWLVSLAILAPILSIVLPYP